MVCIPRMKGSGWAATSLAVRRSYTVTTPSDCERKAASSAVVPTSSRERNTFASANEPPTGRMREGPKVPPSGSASKGKPATRGEGVPSAVTGLGLQQVAAGAWRRVDELPVHPATLVHCLGGVGGPRVHCPS